MISTAELLAQDREHRRWCAKLWTWAAGMDCFQFVCGKEYDFDGCIGTTTDLQHGHWYYKQSSLYYEVPNLTIDTPENERMLQQAVERFMLRTDGAEFNHRVSVSTVTTERVYIL